ncbi:MAG: phosphoribosylanthranilate isomerase [Deltaproteobacteria bacterium]|nr:phosphoribosylanthranilate isomerase [Deltaproteobacteria bacterium]
MAAPIVKICGATSIDEALAIVRAGADAVGLNFWSGSPRRVSVELAAEIAGALPESVWTVGVFVDADPIEIERVRGRVRLTVVQLHGHETAEVCARLGRGVWKAVRRLDEVGAYGCDAYVLDAASGEAPGGTGIRVDPELAVQAALRARVVLAGGLTPENVGDAVRLVRPWGVDVASGVEARPGVKDPGKVEAFVRAAKGAA